MGLSPRTLRPANNFTPRSITGLALWLDASDGASLYTTDAGAVTAVSSPTEIAGCALWLDGADATSMFDATSGGSQVAPGGAIARWQDKSGNGRHFIQSTLTARPTLTTSGRNGRSVVTFDATDDFMQSASTQNIPQPATWIIVYKTPSSLASSWALVDSTTDRLHVYTGSGPDLRMFAGGSQFSVEATVSADQWRVGTYFFNGASSSGRRDGSQAGAGTIGTNATTGTIMLGANNGGAATIKSQIAEAILLTGVTSFADIARVEAYLAQRWGISGVHAPATATSDPVGAWLDKSGNARHATQSTAGSRPTVGTQNGRKAITLDGTNDHMVLGDLSAAFPTAAEIIASYGITSTDTGYVIYQTANNSTHDVASVSGTFCGAFRSVRLPNVALASPTTAGAYLWGVASSSISHELFLQGAKVLSSAADYAAGSNHAIGTRTADGTAATSLAGRVNEVCVFNRVLTSSERQRVNRYLASRWGITLAPTVSNADAQDWINRVYANGGTVSSSTAAAVNQFCNDIDYGVGGVSIRDRFYRLGIFAGSNLNAALVPLYRGPSLGGTQYGNATDTNNAFVGIGTDYAETGATGGLTGNGTTKYLNTGFNVDQLPGAANCHLSSFITGTQDITSVRSLVGTIFNSVTDRYRLFLRSDTSTPPNYTLQVDLGKSDAASQVNRTNTSVGLFVGSRTSTTRLVLYANAAQVGINETTVAETTGASPFFVFARNGPTEYYNGRMAAYSIGAGMTAEQVTAYNTAIQAFQTAMGRV